MKNLRRLTKWIPAIAFLAGTFPSTAKDRPAIASVDLRDYAARYGRSAGNDLGNEILVRMGIKGVKFDSGTRNQCYAAVSRLLSYGKMPVPWILPDGKSTELQPIGEPAKRRFTLELPGGMRWDEEVEIVFRADPKHSTPDCLALWIEFTITEPDNKNARITISGACQVYRPPMG